MDSKNQARWTSYAPYDAYSTFLGFTIPELSERKENPLWEKDQISFFPVPVADKWLIMDVKSAVQSGTIEVQFYNVPGQLIQTKQIEYSRDKSNQYQINLEGLASGQYYVRVHFNSTWSSHKLVVVH